MATFPLVSLKDDLAPLVKTSLEHRGVPITAVFEVLEVPFENRFIAVVTPLVESRGLREAYLTVFKALEAETFATKDLLRLTTLVLSTEELREIRKYLKRGMSDATVPSLAHLHDVIVRPVEDARNIQKTGMLHIDLNRNGSLGVLFGDFGKNSGTMKRLHVENMDALRKVFRALRLHGSLANKIASDLQKSGHDSVPVTCSLEDLYTQGLI